MDLHFRHNILSLHCDLTHQQHCSPQTQQVYAAMDPLLVYTIALMHLSSLSTPMGSGETLHRQAPNPTTIIAAPCFQIEISLLFGSLGRPLIQCDYGALDNLLAYRPAPMHLSSYSIPIHS